MNPNLIVVFLLIDPVIVELVYSCYHALAAKSFLSFESHLEPKTPS